MSSTLPIQVSLRVTPIYTAAADQTAFSVNFPFQEDRDLRVARMDVNTPDAVEVELFTLGVHYQVTGAGAASGGTVTFLAGRTAGDLIRITGEAAIDRVTDTTQSGKFRSEAFERWFDRMTIWSQELRRDATSSAVALESALRAEAAEAAALGSQVAAEAAEANTLAVVADNVASRFNTKAAVEAFNVDPTVEIITIYGYTVSGDGGGARYKRVGVEPAHAGKIQSLDGAWWELIGRVVTPQMFGAVADGSTDTTTAVQAAIDYAETLVSDFNRGATVLLPPGGYFVSSTLTINRNQITIQGYGQASMFIRTGNYGNLLTVVGPDPDNTKIIGVQLRDFYVLCKVNPVTNGAMIEVIRASRVHIDNVSLQDHNIGILLRGCDNIWMTDVDILSGQFYVALQGGSANIQLDPYDSVALVRTTNSNIYLDNAQLKTDISEAYVKYGLRVTSADGFYISNSHIGFTDEAISLAPFDTTANIQHVSFVNCYIDGNVEQTTYLLFVADAITSPPHTGLMFDVVFTNCRFVRPNLKAVIFSSPTSKQFKFMACEFEGGNSDGIQFSNAPAKLIDSLFSGCIWSNWNRDNVGAVWEVRFLVGNTSENISFSHCQFLSTFVSENFAFAGSENDIRIDHSKFSKAVFGGTLSGKNIRNINPSGMTSGFSENYGTASISPDANGQGLIAHGLLDTPTYAMADVRGDSPVEAEVTGYGAANMTVRIHDAAGADVIAGTFDVHWIAKV